MVEERNGGGHDRPTDGHDGVESARTADGRFKPGYCPNPKGRPRKAKPDLNEILLKILDEEMPTPGHPTRRTMSVKEALAHSLCSHALKQPRIALALLQLAANVSRSIPDAEAEADVAVDDALLANFLERRQRRGGTRNADTEEEPEGEEAGAGEEEEQ